MIWEYRRDVSEIERTFARVEEGYLPSLAESAWLLDREQLGILVDGIQRLPDFDRRELTMERQRLLDTLPSYVPPALLATGGGLVLIAGISFLATGLEAAVNGRVGPDFLAGASLSLPGIAAFVFGFMWSRERSLDREQFEDRIEEIEKELGW